MVKGRDRHMSCIYGVYMYGFLQYNDNMLERSTVDGVVNQPVYNYV